MAKKTSWPSKKELDKILDELEQVEGSLHLNSDASALDKFRFQLCQRLLAYKMKHDLKQRELAEKLGIDEAVMSKVLHHRIEKISTDKLIEYVQIIEPDVNLLVA
jgi:predicted XRE-type DNA-binding protein